MTRQQISTILRTNDPSNKIATVYRRVMTVVILLSLLPLCFKESNPIFDALELVTVSIFIVDYILRWITADLKLGKGGWSFLIYPFTPMAIIDLLSILPAFAVMNPSWKLSRLFRMARILRAFKLMRYSRSVRIIENVFLQQKRALGAVLLLAFAYIFISALVVFNVEPDTFDTLFDAIYWAVISLTTVGYGDIYPKSETGRFVAMVSSVMGIAVVALPSAIITAGLMDELKNNPEGSVGDNVK